MEKCAKLEGKWLTKLDGMSAVVGRKIQGYLGDVLEGALDGG